MLIGCEQELDKPILFKLSNGFRGLIALEVDRDRGARFDDGGPVYEITIPSDGILAVRDLAILEFWHVVFVEYENGMPVPIAGRLEDESIVAFHSLPFVSHHKKNGKVERQYYFVGTKAECNVARSKL